MAQNKGFFRNAFDALIEARTREAVRQVAWYQGTIFTDHDELTLRSTPKGKR